MNSIFIINHFNLKSFRLKTFLDWKIDNKTPNLCCFHSHWTTGKVTYTFVVFLTSATSLCKLRYENDLVCIILETEQYVIDYANSLSIWLSISVYKLSRLTGFLDQRKRKLTQKYNFCNQYSVTGELIYFSWIFCSNFALTFLI